MGITRETCTQFFFLFFPPSSLASSTITAPSPQWQPCVMRSHFKTLQLQNRKDSRPFILPLWLWLCNTRCHCGRVEHRDIWCVCHLHFLDSRFEDAFRKIYGSGYQPDWFTRESVGGRSHQVGCSVRRRGIDASPPRTPAGLHSHCPIPNRAGAVGFGTPVNDCCCFGFIDSSKVCIKVAFNLTETQPRQCPQKNPLMDQTTRWQALNTAEM